MEASALETLSAAELAAGYEPARTSFLKHHSLYFSNISELPLENFILPGHPDSFLLSPEMAKQKLLEHEPGSLLSVFLGLNPELLEETFNALLVSGERPKAFFSNALEVGYYSKIWRKKPEEILEKMFQKGVERLGTFGACENYKEVHCLAHQIGIKSAARVHVKNKNIALQELRRLEKLAKSFLHLELSFESLPLEEKLWFVALGRNLFPKVICRLKKANSVYLEYGAQEVWVE